MTETGKGDRWEGDRLGRSEPAFRVASTTALPPPTCTAWREAGQRRLLAVVLLRGLYRPDRQQLCYKACAGRIVRRLCWPATALFCRLCCLPPSPCHAHCPPQRSCPRSLCFAPTCSFPCAPGSSLQAARTVPLAATTRVCSGCPRAALHPPPIHCAARTAP